MLHVAVCTNKNYLPGTFVTLGSLLDANGGRDGFVLHVLDTGIGVAGRGALSRFIASFPNAELRFHDVDTARFKNFTKHFDGDFSTYSRLLLGTFIGAPRCIYIDVDFIVPRDVAELWNRDMGGKVFWAIRSYRFYTNQIDSMDYDCPFPLTEEERRQPYHCVGIMLCDLDAWRAAGVEQKALEIAGRPGLKLKLHDQTILNYLLLGKIGELERPWSYFADNDPLVANTNYHFINAKKPWGKKDFCTANVLWSVYYKIRVRPFYRFRKPWKTRLYNLAWEIRTCFFAFVFTETYLRILREKGKPEIITNATRVTLNAYRRRLLCGLDAQSKTVLGDLTRYWESRRG